MAWLTVDFPAPGEPPIHKTCLSECAISEGSGTIDLSLRLLQSAHQPVYCAVERRMGHSSTALKGRGLLACFDNIRLKEPALSDQAPDQPTQPVAITAQWTAKARAVESLRTDALFD